MSLLAWIKANAREGSNIAEAEEMISKIDINQMVTSKDQALSFVEDNKHFRSAVDHLTTKRVEKHDLEVIPNRIEAEREKLKKELQKELNPDITPEQKRIADLEAKLTSAEKRDSDNALKSELRAKAKELGYDTSRAEKYTIYGENALKSLEDDVTFFNDSMKIQLDKQIKDRFGANVPPRQGSQDPTKVMTRDNFTKLTPVDQRAFISDKGTVTD